MFKDKHRYMCPRVTCPPFNEARTNIGLSSAMGFLNENESDLFCSFGRIVVRSVFYCGLFQDFKFPLIISWIF